MLKLSTNKERKGFKTVNLKEIIENAPKRRKFKYTHNDGYFTIHLFNEKRNKWVEHYYFKKDTCRTTLQQFDWLYQVGDKVWMDQKYKFMKAFDNALKEWNKEGKVEYR